jgi:hypothetical protein
MMTLGCVALQPGFSGEWKSGRTMAAAISPRVPPDFRTERMARTTQMVLIGWKKKINK